MRIAGLIILAVASLLTTAAQAQNLAGGPAEARPGSTIRVDLSGAAPLRP